MLRNYFNVAVRNLLRNKSASLIKVISLSVGMICFAIISLFIHHELSYDRFHENPKQVFRVVKDFVNDDGSRTPDATTPPAFGPAIQKDLPEVAYTTRLFPNWGRKYLIQYDDTRSYEEGVLRIDSSFFDVFSFHFVKGEKKSATANPNFIILTESTARRIFGNEDPMGKALKMDIAQVGTDFLVTGIIKDVPENSHFTFDFLISLRTFDDPLDDVPFNSNWGFYNFYTYVRLNPKTDPQVFQSKLQEVFKKYNPDSKTECYAQPLADIHLKSNLKWELSTNGDYSYIRILGIIALFTIILAAINYINLVTAQSARRAKEVGIRKASGAVRSSLVKQFLSESLIMSIIATIISIAAVESILPELKNLLNSTLSFFNAGSINVLSMVIAVGIITGLLSGLYPAFYLSSFEPIKVLRGAVTGFGGDTFLRKGLVTFQFIISTVLIIGTFVISDQINFVRNKNLGFSKENIVIIENANGLQNRQALLTEIKKSKGVINAGAANGVLGGLNWTTTAQAKGQEKSLLLNLLSTDYDFLDVMGVNFSEGRNFSRETQADSAALILNEIAVKQLGIKDALGIQVTAGGDPYTVIGVIDDFHFSSFHEPIKPFGFFLIEQSVSKLFVKIQGDRTVESITEIKRIWTTLVPDRPFEFTFQDEQVSKLYDSEVKFQKLFSNFTLIAILIACLGLFGLSAYTAQQRTKEIGIRKVLGATIPEVTRLLSKEFLKLVLLAVAIAVPVAWYTMTEWLQNFAYHVELDAWTFFLSGFVAVLIALFTVSFQSIKAALTNPVNSLRNE
jgi:putative ABC transport system permease protein